MNNTNETIPDIVREMRNKADAADAWRVGYPESWENQIEPDDVDDWADRLEAACKRTIAGNVATMRKAPEVCSDELYEILGMSDLDDRRIANQRQTVRAALSASANKAEGDAKYA